MRAGNAGLDIPFQLIPFDSRRKEGGTLLPALSTKKPAPCDSQRSALPLAPWAALPFLGTCSG